jgi:hypothetical protein
MLRYIFVQMGFVKVAIEKPILMSLAFAVPELPPLAAVLPPPPDLVLAVPKRTMENTKANPSCLNNHFLFIIFLLFVFWLPVIKESSIISNR